MTPEKIQEEISNITVLDQFVLIKQIMTKKSGIISMDMARDKKDQFDYTAEIVQLGPKCERGIKLGDKPLLSQHHMVQSSKVIEKTATGMILLIIMHENDIIGIDNSPEIAPEDN